MLSIKKSLIDYRGKNSLTQKDLAAILNVSRATLGKWETGRHAPSPLAKMRILVATALDLR